MFFFEQYNMASFNSFFPSILFFFFFPPLSIAKLDALVTGVLSAVTVISAHTGDRRLCSAGAIKAIPTGAHEEEVNRRETYRQGRQQVRRFEHYISKEEYREPSFAAVPKRPGPRKRYWENCQHTGSRSQ